MAAPRVSLTRAAANHTLRWPAAQGPLARAVFTTVAVFQVATHFLARMVLEDKKSNCPVDNRCAPPIKTRLQPRSPPYPLP